jgi:capsular polysaccharide biosynthesis protein
VVSVVDDNVTNLVTVTVEWTDRSIAAEWANDLIVNANERLRAQAIDDADLTIEYLNQELAKTNAVELQQAIYFLVESEIQKRTMAKVQDEYAFQVLSPATSSDVDKYMRPNRIFIVSVGLLLGLFLGFLSTIGVTVVGRIRSDLRIGSSSN